MIDMNLHNVITILVIVLAGNWVMRYAQDKYGIMK